MHVPWLGAGDHWLRLRMAEVAHVPIVAIRVKIADLKMVTFARDPGDWPHALGDTARVVRLQKYRDPVIRFEGSIRGMKRAGVDFGQLSDDGRLQSIVGFFGETPASA